MSPHLPPLLPRATRNCWQPSGARRKYHIPSDETSILLRVHAYRNRKLFQDSGTTRVWKVSALVTILFLVLGFVGTSGQIVWFGGVVLMALITWRGAHSGIWAGQDDILIIHPVWGRRRVRWDDIDRFVVAPFNQWMIAYVITQDNQKIPCQGISSGRKRTERVDVVVYDLNDLLRRHVPASLAGNELTR